jgi:transcriptional regulator of acetoin/glycerol metabolism
MEPGKILDPAEMAQAIKASHLRSTKYGINTQERNPEQQCLSPVALEERKRSQADFLEVATSRIEEFYELLSPQDFSIGVVDGEGYILHLAGSDEVKAKFAERNCAPGFRWTEQDVGTTAISLCLETQCPIQLNDKDHFCQRAHGFTSSAAPVLGPGNTLRGILFVSGSSSLVHPHTLIMITAAARSIEKQLQILRHNREMTLNIGFLDSIIESTGTGLMAIDREMRIWRINRKGKQILQKDDLSGKPLSSLGELYLDLHDIKSNPHAWSNRECVLSGEQGNIHFIYSAQPVLSARDELLGAVLAFDDIGRIRKLADNIAGTKAFFTFDHLVGTSPAFRHAIDLARRAAQNDSTVLLQGETGTGKELFAQAIHNASNRHSKPFVPINCGAIPGELLESELFGYVDGAFTGAMKGGRPGKFELSSGGTLLLDEIGDMPHDMQVKLLRVLQTGEVYRIGARKPVQFHTRIIASTHVDLKKAVQQKRFREDLYYRLNVFPIPIPPLRSRGPEDIAQLTRLFLGRKRVTPAKLTTEAHEALGHYQWPGNVRELENTIQRALTMFDGETLELRHLNLPQIQQGRAGVMTGTLREIERQAIGDVLERTGKNMAASAKVLGVSRATLYRKVKEYNLE